MHISGVSMSNAPSPSSGGGKRARILRQIEKLEEKRDKLIESVTGKSGSGDSSSASSAPVASGTVRMTASAASAAPAVASENAAMSLLGGAMATGSSAVAGGLMSVATVAAGAATAAASVPAPATLRMAAPVRPSGGADAFELEAAPDDPEELMKMIAAIDAQIMALRAQLESEDTLSTLEEAPELEDAAGFRYENEFGDRVDISEQALAQQDAAAPAASPAGAAAPEAPAV